MASGGQLANPCPMLLSRRWHTRQTTRRPGTSSNSASASTGRRTRQRRGWPCEKDDSTEEATEDAEKPQRGSPLQTPQRSSANLCALRALCGSKKPTCLSPQPSLSLEKTSCNPEATLQFPAFHPTRILPWMASSGRPRVISALRSSSNNWMASIRFCFVSSIVSPWPLAPGISGQIAQNRLWSRFDDRGKFRLHPRNLVAKLPECEFLLPVRSLIMSASPCH